MADWWAGSKREKEIIEGSRKKNFSFFFFSKGKF
jgi:hypothetical protein